jgi:hypothetical protein
MGRYFIVRNYGGAALADAADGGATSKRAWGISLLSGGDRRARRRLGSGGGTARRSGAMTFRATQEDAVVLHCADMVARLEKEIKIS